MKRFQRWLQNERINAKVLFLPFARILLRKLAFAPLVLVIDGSTVGRNCVALMVGVVYQRRTLPIAWLVSRGKKGHFPEKVHVALIREVHQLIPKQARVVLLGDGEFDGVNLQAIVNEWQWGYVCRTARNTQLFWQDQAFRFDDLDECLSPGGCIELDQVCFTKKHYGPILAIGWWRADCKEAIYLVSNLDSAQEACQFYAKRFKIETFFSDQKGRGFNLHKSHLSDPARLSRLLIATCLAYIWIVYLGELALKNGCSAIIHRTDRLDLSLFKLGLRYLEYCLNEGLNIPVAFHVPLDRARKSVR